MPSLFRVRWNWRPYNSTSTVSLGSWVLGFGPETGTGTRFSVIHRMPGRLKKSPRLISVYLRSEVQMQVRLLASARFRIPLIDLIHKWVWKGLRLCATAESLLKETLICCEAILGRQGNYYMNEMARLPTALQVCIKTFVYFTKTLYVKYSKYFIFSCVHQIHI